MNRKKMNVMAASVLLTLPLVNNGMFLALAHKARSFSNAICKRTVCKQVIVSIPSDLLNKINTPRFTFPDTQKIVWKLPYGTNVEWDVKSDLMESIVWKATEYPKSDKKYATVLNQLRAHTWSKDSYYDSVMLHSAVISNLPHVTQELVSQDDNWVHEKDRHGCVPMDYAQSQDIVDRLKAAGSREAQPYRGEDKWYRLPDHGWQAATPLRKAVYDGDMKAFEALMPRIGSREGIAFIAKNETEILRAITSLRFWRTRDEKYLKIKDIVNSFYNKNMSILQAMMK